MLNRYLAAIAVTSLLMTPAARAGKKAHPSPVVARTLPESIYSRRAIRDLHELATD